jgi:hypothetical protein
VSSTRTRDVLEWFVLLVFVGAGLAVSVEVVGGLVNGRWLALIPIPLVGVLFVGAYQVIERRRRRRSS